MRKGVVVAILLLAGVVGATISGWIASAVSVTMGTTYQIFGTVGLVVLGLGFAGGIGAPFAWQMGRVGCESERWRCVLPLAAGLGAIMGIIILAVEKSGAPVSLISLVPYVIVFIVVAEIVGILGRGFGWLLWRVSE